jgi:ABC-type branched-subunit amino acid transport system substrate-binding protein
MRTFYSPIISLLIICFPLIASAEPDTRFRVGMALPLSGALEEYGIASRSAVILATETFSKINKHINFIYEDTRGENVGAISAYNKLRSIDRVQLIMVWGFGPVQAVAPIAESQKVPLIAFSAERNVSIGKKYMIRFNFYAEQVGEVLANYFRKQGKKHYGIVKSEQAFLNAIYDGFASSLRPGERVDLIENYQVSDMDFMPSILKARKRGFDALGVLLWPGQIGKFYQQLKVVGGGLETFGPHLFENRSEISLAGDAMNGAVFGLMNVTDDFRSRYTKRFANDNRISFAASAYDFATLTGKLFQSDSSTLSSEEILARYRNAPPLQGANGEIRYVNTPTEGPSYLFNVQIRKIEDGRIVAAE